MLQIELKTSSDKTKTQEEYETEVKKEKENKEEKPLRFKLVAKDTNTTSSKKEKDDDETTYRIIENKGQFKLKSPAKEDDKELQLPRDEYGTITIDSSYSPEYKTKKKNTGKRYLIDSQGTIKQ